MGTIPPRRFGKNDKIKGGVEILTVKIESNFGREIMKNIDAQWTRIENRHGGGIPDLYGIRDGVSIWLELKCINKNSINISPLQISWNYNHFQQNGKNYYIVRDARSKVIKLYDGDKGRELKEQGFKCPCNAELRPPYNWQLFQDHLFPRPMCYDEFDDEYDDDEYNPDLD